MPPSIEMTLRVAHLLQVVGRQRRAETAAAVEDDRRVLVGDQRLDVALEHAAADVAGAARRGRPANSLSSRTSTKWNCSPRSSRALTSRDGALLDARLRLVHQRQESRAMLHGREHRNRAPRNRPRASGGLTPSVAALLRTERSPCRRRRDYYEVLGVDAQRRTRRAEARLPPAGDGAAPRPQPRQPRGRGPLQGGVGGLPGPLRPAEARPATTASATPARAAASAAPASATSATSSRPSPTSSATSSAAAAAAGAGRRAAPTSRRASRDHPCRRRRPASPRRSRSSATPPARPAAAAAPRPGRTPETCQHCGGRGQVMHSQGFLMISSTCPVCRGEGRVVRKPCTELRRERRRPAGGHAADRDPGRRRGRLDPAPDGAGRGGAARRAARQPLRRPARRGRRALRARRRRPAHRGRGQPSRSSRWATRIDGPDARRRGRGRDRRRERSRATPWPCAGKGHAAPRAPAATATSSPT